MSEKMEMRVQIDVEAIKRRLYEDPAVRAQIMCDYGINSRPTDAHEFASAVLGQLEQEPRPRPLEQEYGNGDVGLMLCLASYLGQPPTKWEGSRYLGARSQHVSVD